MTRGDWLQTYTGRRFHPADPRPEDIDIEDIAHGLSHLCRFAGQCSRFYSIAEHSVLVSFCVPREHAMQALLHDAAEAYLVDIPRPLKLMLPGYVEIEDRAWAAVAQKFGVPVEMHSSVKQADNDVLLAERDALFVRPVDWSVRGTPANVEIIGLDPATAKSWFLRRYHQLLLASTPRLAELAATNEGQA
jgi:hypothetical protein